MTLDIPANDFGQIRVLATQTPLAPDAPDQLAQLLGTDALDPTYIDVVNIADLGPLMLSDYIAQGYDMATDAMDRDAVNAITGYAILILSRAARSEKVTLSLAPGVRHVTTYAPTMELIAPTHLPDASAKGVIGSPPTKAPKSDARIGGMVATVALLLMFALVGLMIWVAG